MVRELKKRKALEKQPFYGLIWERLKHFPQFLANGSSNPPTVRGPAAAALLSAGIGSVLMMVSHHLADTSKERESFVWAIGSWIPGSHNADKMWGEIGSYSGKETVLLIGWLASWAILHRLWRDRHIRTRTMFLWFGILFVLATVMSWTPLFPYLQLGI